MTPWSAARLYRPFVRAALIVGVALGFSTGTAMLLLPELGVDVSRTWIAHIQAHGVSQLFGWAGLFTMGVAWHVIPRFRNASPAFPWPQRATLALILAGVMLRYAGQTFAQAFISGGMLLASGAALLAGTVIFAASIAQVLRRGAASQVQVEPWIWAALAWGVVAAGLHLAVVIRMSSDGIAIAYPDWNRAFAHAFLLGFLANFVFAVTLRAVSGFLSLRPRRLGLNRWGMIAFNLGAAWYVIAAAAGSASVWPGTALIVEAAGVLIVVASLRILEPGTRRRSYIAGTYARYEWFVRTAYLWLVVGATLSALQGVGFLRGASLFPTFAAAPIVHAVGLGFITLMIGGMGARMLPLFDAAEIPNHALLDIALVALNLSVALRVVFGLAGGSTSSAGLAVSGSIGMIGFVFLAAPLWRVLQPAARRAYQRRAIDLGAEHVRRLEIRLGKPVRAARAGKPPDNTG